MRGVVLVVNQHILGISLFVLTILVLAIAQSLIGPLTIPVMDKMAATTQRARSQDPDPVAFPAAHKPSAAPAEAAVSPPVDPQQLLGEIHLSAGDTPAHPADPSPSDPLRIGFALSRPADVRVTLTGDDGAVVASIPEGAPSSSGARGAEWNGANTAGQPVPGGRYTLSVEASEDAEVYSRTVHETHVFLAR